uniref:Uncharacterized protein n=1 Tax=Rhizophagus irregularis (strain DAOM 181602 / DAOM 197198 / MUCL 43194) TaxID=747089 RepID=U9TWS7_RHIID
MQTPDISKTDHKSNFWQIGSFFKSSKRFKGPDYEFCETIQVRRKKSTKNA